MPWWMYILLKAGRFHQGNILIICPRRHIIVLLLVYFIASRLGTVQNSKFMFTARLPIVRE